MGARVASATQQRREREGGTDHDTNGSERLPGGRSALLRRVPGARAGPAPGTKDELKCETSTGKTTGKFVGVEGEVRHEVPLDGAQDDGPATRIAPRPTAARRQPASRRRPPGRAPRRRPGRASRRPARSARTMSGVLRGQHSECTVRRRSWLRGHGRDQRRCSSAPPCSALGEQRHDAHQGAGEV